MRTRRLKGLTVRVTPELHRAVKRLSHVERIPMEQIVESALVQYLAAHKEPSHGTRNH